MMLIKKIVTSLTQNGIKNLTAYSATASCERKFHVMVKSMPKSAIETSTLCQNSVNGNVMSPLSENTGIQRLLAPVSSLINQVSGFKVKGRLRRRCKDCYFIVRQQRHYIICPTHPRHKQMSMKKRDYKSWILTHATQSKVRPY